MPDRTIGYHALDIFLGDRAQSPVHHAYRADNRQTGSDNRPSFGEQLQAEPH